ncbi:SDR family NAD(P)-dependent oxidoreductase [Streptomyces sp. NPDC002088]|uniref:SDR family NAD(P)-dependent oxidoreductase n=1 Tax=Streptomyces sp. NPDC002088 TaxID=3154665 RepID=UPI00332F469F
MTSRSVPEASSARPGSRAEELGPVTILVNNTGITAYEPCTDITEASWDRMMRVDLTGPFLGDPGHRRPRDRDRHGAAATDARRSAGSSRCAPDGRGRRSARCGNRRQEVVDALVGVPAPAHWIGEIPASPPRVWRSTPPSSSSRATRSPTASASCR